MEKWQKIKGFGPGSLGVLDASCFFFFVVVVVVALTLTLTLSEIGGGVV